jgi:hypothetical protein
MTVVETPAFLRDSAAALTEEERSELVSYLAVNPEAGDIMPGTGGARKLRWRANLTQAEQNEINGLLPRLISGYRKRMAK